MHLTGANYSVVSQNLVEELNLPIYINNKHNITVADNTTKSTTGTCKHLLITLNDKTYECEAIVLAQASHDLLLGMNWMVKNKVKIDMEKQVIEIPDEKSKNLILFECKRYKDTNIRPYEIKTNLHTCYANEKTIIPPRTTKILNVKLGDTNKLIPTNSLIYVHETQKHDLKIIPGTTDINNNLDKIMVINTGLDNIIVEKGQKVTHVSTITNGKITDIQNVETIFNPQEYIDCYKGKVEYKIPFIKMLDELKETKLTKQPLNEFHERKSTEDTNKIKAKPYRTSIKEKEEITNHVNEMKEQGIIRTSYSKYSSPVVLVTKPDGSYRFCVDYRILNKFTIRDNFPLPRIDDALDELTKAKFFSKIDLKSGYWQIPVKEEDKCKTAFVAHCGLFEFNVMPSGLSNVPATFQRIINNIFSDFYNKFSITYLDDILIYSTTFEEHLEHIKKVLQKIIVYNLKINFSKSEFFNESIAYLGYKISQIGIQISEEKINAIRNIPIPKNTTSLQSFIGLMSYFRKFIPNFATQCFPLTLLLRKNQKFKWEKNEQVTYENLKEQLMREPILSFPNFNEQFIVTIDASINGLGAMLSQMKHEKECAIAFASRITTQYEKNYLTHELEGLGLMFALKIWRVYLIGKKFLVKTDNSALTYIQKNKDHVNKLARWSLQLQEFDFEIIHTKGKNNLVADCLSRYNKENDKENKIEINNAEIDNILKTQENKEKLITEHHIDIGHGSKYSTYKSMQNHYRWPNMRKEIYETVAKCQECQLYNDTTTHSNKHFFPLMIGESMERIGIDIIGPMNITLQGNRYIIVAIDYLTKFIFFKSNKNKNSNRNCLNYL